MLLTSELLMLCKYVPIIPVALIGPSFSEWSRLAPSDSDSSTHYCAGEMQFEGCSFTGFMPMLAYVTLTERLTQA